MTQLCKLNVLSLAARSWMLTLPIFCELLQSRPLATLPCYFHRRIMLHVCFVVPAGLVSFSSPSLLPRSSLSLHTFGMHPLHPPRVGLLYSLSLSLTDVTHEYRQRNTHFRIYFCTSLVSRPRTLLDAHNRACQTATVQRGNAKRHRTAQLYNPSKTPQYTTAMQTVAAQQSNATRHNKTKQ